MIGSVLANRSAKDRSVTDFYPTPPDVTVALLDFLEMDKRLYTDQTIWEPACGTGEMAAVMKGRGYDVISTDLHPTGYGHPLPVDFLDTTRVPSETDWIITNPPFSLAEKFIRHALELERPFAFLLKSQFWHARKRLDLFEMHPPAYVLPLTWRPDFLWGAQSGSPTMDVLWTIWMNQDCITEYHPLRRPPQHPFTNGGN